MNNNIVTYETPQGHKITLTPQIVKKYLVSGGGGVTDQEIMMFLALCKFQKLNPFLREAYLVKYGNEPATIITGKEVFTKRAASLKECKGFEGGVIIRNKEGIEYRKGTLVLDDEKLVGGWAKVYRQDWDVPLENTVSLNEYLRKKKDGTPMASWATMPATMIRKVALVQALREAFPGDFGGMYAPEEMPVDVDKLSDDPVYSPEVENTVDAEKIEDIEDLQDWINAEVINGQDETPAKTNGGKASEAQIKAIFAIAKSKGIDNEYIKGLLKERYGLGSTKDLTKTQASEIIEELQATGA